MTTTAMCRSPRHICLAPRPTPAGPRGLCPTCEAGLPRILDQLARDYCLLVPLLGQPPAARGLDVTGTREHHTPLNVHVDELMGRIVHLVCWWEDQTLAALGRPAPDRAGVHPSWRISRAVATLVARRPVWLALTERPYTPDPERPPVLMDGVGAAVEAMGLHRTAQTTVLPEQRTTVHRVQGRCMACGWASTLRREDGGDLVWCANCHDQQTLDQYQDYLGCFTPAVRALGVR